MTDDGRGLEPADPNDLPQVGNRTGVPAMVGAEGVTTTGMPPTDAIVAFALPERDQSKR